MQQPTDSDAPLRAVRECLEQLDRTLGIAQRLVEAGQRIDLAGLQSEVGFVCARALDLPPDQGRGLRAGLIDLRTALDSVAAALAARAPPGA